MSQYQSTSTLQTSVISWSIPRSERFELNKINCDNLYAIPESKSKRSTTVGYGTKYDLMPLAGKDTPGPDKYNLRSSFDNPFNKKGVIIGQKFKNSVCFNINNNYIKYI